MDFIDYFNKERVPDLLERLGTYTITRSYKNEMQAFTVHFDGYEMLFYRKPREGGIYLAISIDGLLFHEQPISDGVTDLFIGLQNLEFKQRELERTLLRKKAVNFIRGEYASSRT